MEEVVERGNLKLSYQRVAENKGAPGVDGRPRSSGRGGHVRRQNFRVDREQEIPRFAIPQRHSMSPPSGGYGRRPLSGSIRPGLHNGRTMSAIEWATLRC